MRGFLFVAVLVAALAGGCGRGGTEGGSGREATLLLDSPPRALHAGIYLAVARDYDDAEGTPVQIRPAEEPGAALATGRADLAIMDILDLARARERGLDLVGVMALVQEPLDGDGGSEGVSGIQYPQYVLVVTRETLEDREGDVRAVIRAVQRGYEEVAVDPESAVTTMIEADPGLDRASLAEDLDAVDEHFEAGVSDYGMLVGANLEEWAKRARDQGLVEKPVDVGRAFDGSLVAASGR